MKAVIKDVLWGLILAIAYPVIQTLLFFFIGGNVYDASTWWGRVWASGGFMDWFWLTTTINLVTALIVGLLAFGLAWASRTHTKFEALRRGIVWAVMLLVVDIAIALPGANWSQAFGNAGVYVVYAVALAGPMAYAWARHLPGMWSIRTSTPGDGQAA